MDLLYELVMQASSNQSLSTTYNNTIKFYLYIKKWMQQLQTAPLSLSTVCAFEHVSIRPMNYLKNYQHEFDFYFIPHAGIRTMQLLQERIFHWLSTGFKNND